MSSFRLFLRSLRFYWRGHCAVMLGMVVGTAVIGGALIVGDSVRGSLRQMTFDRLGGIDYAVTGDHFFREALAEELLRDADFSERFRGIAPAIVLTGGVEYRRGKTGAVRQADVVRRAGKVSVYGVDSRLWGMLETGELTRCPEGRELFLNRRVADALGVSVGDLVSVWVELPATVPRDSLLGKRDRSAVEISLTVSGVLDDSAGASRLSLRANQQMPAVLFVSLRMLQRELELHERRVRDRKSRRVVVKPRRVNSLFVQGKNLSGANGAESVESGEFLDRLLRRHVVLSDFFLRVTPIVRGENGEGGYLSLESEQQILSDDFADVGFAVAERLGLRSSPVFVYLANELVGSSLHRLLDYGAAGIGSAGVLGVVSSGKTEAGETGNGGRSFGWYSRYSVIAGVDGSTLLSAPFGPFRSDVKGRLKGENVFKDGIGDGEIVVNRWLADDLGVRVGDVVVVKFHLVGEHIVGANGLLPERVVRFVVRDIVALDGSSADDRGFVPVVEGITDVATFAEWEKPFPMRDVTSRDDDYWKRYGATPKAFVSLDVAETLWGSRYGRLTSLRVSGVSGEGLAESSEIFQREFLGRVQPGKLGMRFRAVKFLGLQAADGTTDFRMLFLSFSFFLIFSAAILIGLLFRLNIEQRGVSVGLLLAVGFSGGQLRRQFFAEAAAVIFLGGLLGMLAAWGYAAVMIYGLRTWWVGAIGTQELRLFVELKSLLIGVGVAVVIAGFAVWWAVRYLSRLSARELLGGGSEISVSSGVRGRGMLWISVVSGVGALLLLGASVLGMVPVGEALTTGMSWSVVSFFLSGLLLLVSGWSWFSWRLGCADGAGDGGLLAVRGSGVMGVFRLGIRNVSRHRSRSELTVALIASATFVITAVAAGHRDPGVERPVRGSGNGGFSLVAESSVPILHDLNGVLGRRAVGIDFEEEIAAAVRRGDLAGVESLKREAALLAGSSFLSFRMKPGDEASCLNIYQTRLPTVLGVSSAMVRRGGFKFIGLTADEGWELLGEELGGDENGVPTYPVLGDMNTLQYSLHKGVGSVISVPNEEEVEYRLKVVGMLDGSVFQGVLLLSDENFQRVYPKRVGFRYFLVDVGEGGDADAVSEILESRLNRFGFDAELVSDRLANFLAVQNTYLSTFQTVGGLGLLLGTLGLGTVMLRNVLERRSELALLRAVGFRNSLVAGLVLCENGWLLCYGLFSGAVAGLLAMCPHLLSRGSSVSWEGLLGLLFSLFAVGMLSALLAVFVAIRTPIVATLRAG